MTPEKRTPRTFSWATASRMLHVREDGNLNMYIVYMYVYIYIYMHIYIHTHRYIYIHIYIHIYIYIYIHIYIYIYLSIYIYIYMLLQSNPHLVRSNSFFFTPSQTDFVEYSRQQQAAALFIKLCGSRNFLRKLSKLSNREVSNMDVSIRKVKTAAADSPRLFFTALGYSKDQSDSMSSC